MTLSHTDTLRAYASDLADARSLVARLEAEQAATGCNNTGAIEQAKAAVESIDDERVAYIVSRLGSPYAPPDVD